MEEEEEEEDGEPRLRGTPRALYTPERYGRCAYDARDSIRLVCGALGHFPFPLGFLSLVSMYLAYSRSALTECAGPLT